MSYWLGTNNGARHDLEKIDTEHIDLKDIVEGLIKVCRFNGQINVHYSVAQHSMYVADLVPDRLKYQAILHDAAEAFICDIPTPLKLYLGDRYLELERRFNLAIGQKMGVDLINLHPTVKLADRIMVVSERDALQFKPQSWGPEYDDAPRYPGIIHPYEVDPDEFRELVERYQELASR